MSIHEWDQAIAPYLRSVTDHARWLSYHGRGVSTALAMLPTRPEWTTQAENALAEVEKELTAALDLTREARRRYADKPIIMDAA